MKEHHAKKNNNNNLEKSAITFGPNLEPALHGIIKFILPIPVVPFHEKYLDLPTMVGRNKRQIF